MRVILGVFSLLVVVAVVGFLAKKQVKSVNEIQVPVLSAPADATTPPASMAPGNVQQQSQAIQQQFKAAAEAAVQQARPVPDDK
jgi:hypothetical protein